MADVKTHNVTAVEEASAFFSNLVKEVAASGKSEKLPANSSNTAIYADKSDERLYDWALNG